MQNSKCQQCQTLLPRNQMKWWNRSTFCSKECIQKCKKSVPKNLVGWSYQGSTVIESFVPEDILHRTKKYYKIRCKCGQIFTRRRDYLICVYIKQTSLNCGCEPLVYDLGKKNNRWRGYGDISGAYIAQIKVHAKKRNYPFNITKEYLWDLFLKQDKKCALTGQPLKFSESRNINSEQTASLDRIISSKGYVPGNVQWVHKDINFMKKNWDEDKFIQLCKMIANYK